MTQTPSGSAASAPRSRKDPVQLLVEAVGTLPQADRDLVYAWLLRRLPDPVADELTRPGGPGGVRMAAALLQPGMTVAVSGSTQQFPQSSGQQMVPVRFSSEQHARLREWCAQHGFSMATVVRGLVARFLEGQLPEAGQQV